MNFLEELISKSENIQPKKAIKDIFIFIGTLEKELSAYNVATLNQDSEDIFGKPIGFYSAATELITDGKKKRGEPFDLLESGDFLDGLFSKVQKDSIFFDTSDSKKNDVLKNLLSENIFGLQEQDLNKVIETKILPFIIDFYKKELTLG